VNDTSVEQQILNALKHPEAEEGLFLGNFHVLHEEDERPRVNASEEEILISLKELMRQGKVVADTKGEDVIFMLPQK
jgi:hypothetical protein